MFVGYPLWWALGIVEIVSFIAVGAMLYELSRMKRVRVPSHFGWWLLFLAWVVLSVVTVQIDAPGAIEGSSLTRYLTWGWRLLWYAKATVVMLYIGNMRDRLSMAWVCRVLGWMFVFIVFGGLLGVADAGFQFRSLLEIVLPRSISSIAFVQANIHPVAAESFLTGGTRAWPCECSVCLRECVGSELRLFPAVLRRRLVRPRRGLASACGSVRAGARGDPGGVLAQPRLVARSRRGRCVPRDSPRLQRAAAAADRARARRCTDRGCGSAVAAWHGNHQPTQRSGAEQQRGPRRPDGARPEERRRCFPDHRLRHDAQRAGQLRLDRRRQDVDVSTLCRAAARHAGTILARHLHPGLRRRDLLLRLPGAAIPQARPLSSRAVRSPRRACS